MKAVKIAGIRLVNYLNDGINWKDHKDIVLDFWVQSIAPQMGFPSDLFKNVITVDDMQTKPLEVYQKWFEGYNFQNDQDQNWMDFVNGTLNIFYRTSNPTLMDESIWYIHLLQSEPAAREIAESQLFHGDPNLNSFWKVDTNTKPDEVGGRRNGYLFTKELSATTPADTKGYYWGIAFKCIETVKLFYLDSSKLNYRCINWAANCSNLTLIKVTPTGRFLVEQIFVPGKAWKADRYIPQGAVPNHPLNGQGLVNWIENNYYDMYGIWEDWEEAAKDVRESMNARKNAVNVMNDEEVKLRRLIPDVDNFLVNGNVDPQRRERNKAVRQAIRDKNKLRDREIKKRMRELKKSRNRQDRVERNKINPFISKK
jgi:hypothetical protein